jgi:hypothetical protein
MAPADIQSEEKEMKFKITRKRFIGQRNALRYRSINQFPVCQILNMEAYLAGIHNMRMNRPHGVPWMKNGWWDLIEMGESHIKLLDWLK